MKKRRFICFLIFTMFILGFLISDVAFGQSSKLINHPTYKQTLLREKVRSLLPDFLKVFNGSETQEKMLPRHVNTFLSSPLFLRTLVPGTDDEFIGLLYTNKDFRTLFGADPFYRVLKSSGEINRLLKWFEAQPQQEQDEEQNGQDEEQNGQDEEQNGTESSRPTTLSIVSGNNQSGEVGKLLAQPFVIGVLDQFGKPLQGTPVTFTVTAGQLSGTVRGAQLTGQTSLMIHTNVYGQAETTLTLGPNAVRHSVRARVSGITPQTFTATAITPPKKDKGSSASEAPPMYWIEGNRIYHRLTGGEKDIFFEPEKDVTLTGGLAVDMGGNRVYWTEETSDGTGRVRSADFDGSNIETVTETFAVPFNIAVGTDKSKERWVYWTNSKKKIQRINVDGSGFQGNFMEFRDAPNHIAFDQEEFRLYWTEQGRIRGVAANGIGKRDIIVENLVGELGGIAVADGTVYWTEQTSRLGKIRSVNRSGSGDKLLAVLESTPEGIAVDPVGGKVYWTTADGEVQSASLTGAIQTVVVQGGGPAAGIALGGTAGVPASPTAPSLSPVDSVENTLLANYPNPFNPETWIPYQLSEPADVSVSIYSVNGHLVRRLELGHQSAGVYRSRSRAAYWDGRNEFGERVASGLYFYTLTAGDFTATRKMLIRK